MSRSKIVSMATVKEVENRAASKWVRGVGKDAVFESGSDGWYVTFVESPIVAFAGSDCPSFKPGDRIRITMEHA